jgi:hypothetical protein
MDTKTEVKTVTGLKGSVATFIRPTGGAPIFVFPKKGESVEKAIHRVKSRNGSLGVVHQLVKQ